MRINAYKKIDLFSNTSNFSKHDTVIARIDVLQIYSQKT